MKNKKDISFLLPTNRNHEHFSKKVINNINSLNFFGKTHEIIVISSEEIEGENVIYLKEGEDNEGCVGAYNNGYNASTGDYIFLCSDDHFFDVNCSLIINVLQSRLFENRKYKIICLPTNKHPSCKLPEYTNCDAIIARYPVFERKTVDEYLQGCVYNPKFKQTFCHRAIEIL